MISYKELESERKRIPKPPKVKSAAEELAERYEVDIDRWLKENPHGGIYYGGLGFWDSLWIDDLDILKAFEILADKYRQYGWFTTANYHDSGYNYIRFTGKI